MRSIRAFLLSRLAWGVAAVLLAGAGFVYALVARSLGSQFDLALSERVQGFASLLFQTEDTLTFEFSGELMPEYEREESPEYFELAFVDGRPIERSESLGEATLDVAVEPGEAPAFWTAPLPDGREGRYVARVIEVHHVYPEEGPGRPEAARIAVVLARGTEALVAAQMEALRTCAAVALGLLVLIGVVVRFAVTRGLDPANRLAATIGAIEVDDLPDRLALGDLPTELEPIAEKTNALLLRMRAALERERRTTADIAHELRTPISELITSSEIALRDQSDVEGGRAALSTARDVAWRMERSVSILLQLARLDTGVETFEREPVDLGGLVHECVGTYAATIAERGLELDNSVEHDVWVQGDSEVLRIVLSNLIGNAAGYTPRGGRVACALEGAEDDWCFSIENDTDDLCAADIEQLSEPFWRKDHARADRDRSGLGLALARSLAEHSGLRLGYRLEGGRLRVTLEGRPGNGRV